MARVGPQRQRGGGDVVANLCDPYVMNLLIKRWNNFMNPAIHNENGLVMSIYFVAL